MLGEFGGSTDLTIILKQGTGEGPSEGGALIEDARDAIANQVESNPISSANMRALSANLGSNIILNGDFESWSAGTTSDPDAWVSAGAGASLARDTTNLQTGLASADLSAALNTATSLTQTLTISSTQNAYLQGQFVTFSALVLASVANRVYLQINDGVNTTKSFFHTGGGAFEYLTVTVQLAAAATQIAVSLQIDSGAVATATIDSAILNVGQSPVAFSPNFNDAFIQPRTVYAQDSQTVSSAAFADIPNMSIANVIVNGKQNVIAIFNCNVRNNTATQATAFQTLRGSTVINSSQQQKAHDTANLLDGSETTAVDIKPAAGVYTYKVQWNNDGVSTSTIRERSLTILIIPSA